MIGTSAHRCRRLVRPLPRGPSWREAVGAFAGPSAPGERCMVLDSSCPDGRWGRFSYAGFEPAWLLVMARDGGIRLERCRLALPPGAPPDYSSPIAAIRDAANLVRLAPDQSPAESRFIGGWVGYIGYEAGSQLEKVPPGAIDDIPLPRMQWAFYDAVAAYDHVAGQWELSAIVLDDDRAATRRLDRLQERIESPAAGPEEPIPAQSRRWQDSAACNFTRAGYEQAVLHAKDYIAAGDIYQANISQRFSWPISSAPDVPGRVFRSLRRSHPAWYSAMLCWRGADGVQAICSASPELFLSLKDGHVVTRPIKGTRRSGGDEAADLAAATELMHSPKDAAELAMIVDLERNDLGRVCRFGSVRVTRPRDIETHAHVLHTTATVEGRLVEGLGVAGLLAATFPGGSITGAPKIRAMQIIAELEPTARSAYTGAIGYLGVDGSAMLNIAIRTVILAGGQAHVQVGGGIVADSEPAAEYDETLAKAEGLAQAVAGLSAS